MSNLAEVIPAMPTQAPTTTALSNNTGVFQFNNFNDAMNAAQVLANSTLVPKDYRFTYEVKKGYGYEATTEWVNNQNAAANCLIALNMANRMGYDPLMIMQNLHIIEGRPAWSSQFIIAAINACGKFSPLRFEIINHGMTDVEYIETYWENKKKQTRQIKTQIENVSCVAWAIEKATGERIESAKIDMVMAIKEGWYQKNGSKWQTMPDQMLRYRAAAFFGRIYAPEILMGIYSADEIRDFVDVTPERAPQPAAQPKQQQLPCYDIKPLLAQIEAITTLEQVRPLGEHIKDLSENPNVNLCGDDLPTLRDALTEKRDAIKAQLESVVEAEPVANDEPVSEPKEKVALSGEKKVASDLMKLISGMTLDNVNDVRAELYAAQAQLSEATFNQLDAVLESNLEALTQA
ncbi:Recombinase RecT [Moraxellaceae bacterium 17A]|nr:Recombinase RecT [Moraxellaceae bacterium 17A]